MLSAIEMLKVRLENTNSDFGWTTRLYAAANLVHLTTGYWQPLSQSNSKVLAPAYKESIGRTIRFWHKGIRILDHCSSKRAKQSFLATSANLFYSLGSYELALEYCIEAEELCRVLNDYDGLAVECNIRGNCLYGLAMEFARAGKKSEALTRLRIALAKYKVAEEIHDRRNDVTHLKTVRENLVRCDVELQKLDDA